MPTSVHIPKVLLRSVERRAKVLRLSRNRFIVRALERAIAVDAEWSPGFFEALDPLGHRDAAVVDEMMKAVKKGSRSKKAPEL